ncbi:saccharopine dehydrogenase family protein [Marinoscillum sp. MHG1-6]|uniref:saccharopine dehydrogenase family protein n=1 Tax=Marinoscillum sp. MHG1-6 TaxID=2959627 RepID=UPI00215848F9|nr:saccharopine dehydrogenase family protein [Marinoscillum sp. MHG1-6]
MKQILLIGAGRSASSLIKYLKAHSEQDGYRLIIGDKESNNLQGKYPNCQIIPFDIAETTKASELIQESSLVISMLPAGLHFEVAKICADLGTSLLTASYVTDEIRNLNTQFKKHGKLCLMEMGLDPGIDHMSAMKVLDKIKSEGHRLTSFETFTGGLLAENNRVDNPWGYKFTWNPRNVVLAGTGSVKFIQEGRYKYIPYHRLFKRTEVIHIPGYGYFEGYANRDSLKYLDLYNLRGIRTLYRGTLRRPGFCKAWDIFVQLGATDDSYQMEHVDEMTHRQFLNSFLSYNPSDSVELKLAHYMNLSRDSEEMYKIKHLGLFEEELVGLKEGTPAQILEHILKKSWTLSPEDRDMIVMWHKFKYQNQANETKEIQSSMIILGDEEDTAMAKSVGLPLGIVGRLILKEGLSMTGVHIPTSEEIYTPLLEQLNKMGFEFTETEVQ